MTKLPDTRAVKHFVLWAGEDAGLSTAATAPF